MSRWYVAAIAITLLSYLVWLHHFFTMGAGADVNSFFGIVTMLIAIPSGVQVFNWILTMYKGKVTFASPMYWFIGFFSHIYDRRDGRGVDGISAC